MAQTEKQALRYTGQSRGLLEREREREGEGEGEGEKSFSLARPPFFIPRSSVLSAIPSPPVACI